MEREGQSRLAPSFAGRAKLPSDLMNLMRPRAASQDSIRVAVTQQDSKINSSVL